MAFPEVAAITVGLAVFLLVLKVSKISEIRRYFGADASGKRVGTTLEQVEFEFEFLGLKMRLKSKSRTRLLQWSIAIGIALILGAIAFYIFVMALGNF